MDENKKMTEENEELLTEEKAEQASEETQNGKEEEKTADNKKKKSGFSKKSGSDKLKEEIEHLEEKNEELRDKYLRLFADFDNYKKRVAKERLELTKEAGKDIVMNLLPVLDDFERAVKTIEDSDDINAVKEGLGLIFHKLKKNLEQKGLAEMESLGKDFDPDFHEAVTEIPAPSDEEKGKVLDEIEKGYYLNEKIIRYAKVVVGK